MEKIIIGVGYGSYSFNASTKEVTISGVTTVTLEQFLLIINATQDTVIYNPTCADLGGTLSGSVLTLDYDTTLFNNTDDLQIHFALNTTTDNSPSLLATEATLLDINEILTAGIIVEPVHDDILGVAVSGTRNNQIEVSFDTAFDSSVVTNTNTSTGSATISNGHALYSTGTNANGTSKGVSVITLNYRPAHEEYVYFTAAFTTPTSANSNQRLGLYDANNGFFIGYNGLNFGITKRTSGSDTFTNRTSWNTDLLTGLASSKFTRNGTPEAINLTYSNLFRIRFAWLGSASVVFEVFSPDGKWVIFHTLKVPNSQLNPSITTPNLPITLEVLKSGADATNLIVYTACWAAGTTSNYSKITDTLTDNTLANLTRSVITGRASTGGGSYYNVKVNPSGSLQTSIGDISGVVGQNTMANSLPVTIASNQTAIPISDNGGSVTVDGSVTVSGTVTANTGLSQPLTDAQLRASAVPISGTVTITPSGTQTITGSVSVSNFPATQPVSAASLPLPTGAATSSEQTTSNNYLAALNSLTPTQYDYINCSYTSGNLTGVVYKSGGSGGTTVSTLTLTYDVNNNLTSVTKT
jgi:hypothetical protein